MTKTLTVNEMTDQMVRCCLDQYVIGYITSTSLCSPKLAKLSWARYFNYFNSITLTFS